MRAETCADDHFPAIDGKLPVVIFREKTRIRPDQPADARQPYDPAMVVPGERQVRAPGRVGRKISRKVCKQDVILSRLRLSDQLFHILHGQEMLPCRFSSLRRLLALPFPEVFPVIAVVDLQAIKPNPAAAYPERNTEVVDHRDAERPDPAVIFQKLLPELRHVPHPYLVVAIDRIDRIQLCQPAKHIKRNVTGAPLPLRDKQIADREDSRNLLISDRLHQLRNA